MGRYGSLAKILCSFVESDYICCSLECNLHKRFINAYTCSGEIMIVEEYKTINSSSVKKIRIWQNTTLVNQIDNGTKSSPVFFIIINSWLSLHIVRVAKMYTHKLSNLNKCQSFSHCGIQYVLPGNATQLSLLICTAEKHSKNCNVKRKTTTTKAVLPWKNQKIKKKNKRESSKPQTLYTRATLITSWSIEVISPLIQVHKQIAGNLLKKYIRIKVPLSYSDTEAIPRLSSSEFEWPRICRKNRRENTDEIFARTFRCAKGIHLC